MERNIQLIYVIAFLRNPWFWLGIWVFYYLRFTTYTGIGIIETILFVTVFITEIPTGAIADLLGKRKTLVLGFFLSGFCNLLMTYTPNVYGLMFAVFLGGIGMTCVSGTLDALLYDSLKQQKKESLFPTILGRVNALQLIGPAVLSIIGGFLYTVDPRLGRYPVN